VDQHEAPERQPGEGESAVAEPSAAQEPVEDDYADWETSEQPLVPAPVRYSANGWPIAIGRAAVPSPERLIELDLEPAPPEPEREPDPQPQSVRTPVAAGLVVVSGLMLAGICGFAVLMPGGADVGPGPGPNPPNNVFVLPAPHPGASSPSPAGHRTAPAAGGSTPGNPGPQGGGNQGGNVLAGDGGGGAGGGGAGGGGGPRTVGTDAGGNPVVQPLPVTTAPSTAPSPTGGQPTSSPTGTVPEAQPTTQPPTTEPVPTTTEPSPVTSTQPATGSTGTDAPAVAPSPSDSPSA
jgi:hypothetical protein